MYHLVVGGVLSEVHYGDDVDWWEFIVPNTFLCLSLDDVTGIEDGSVNVERLFEVLHFYEDVRTIR